MNKFTLRKSIPYQLIFLILFALSACKKEELYTNLPVYGPKQIFYALSGSNLSLYDASDVRTTLATVAISGLTGTEKLLSIDFRPATGQLYGVSDASKLYVINTSSGVARPVSNLAFTPALNGTIASMDFNPTVDRIRVVTNTGQNLRLNPETGLVVATDANVASTGILGLGYTNSFAGATATVLYDIDATAKKLYKQDPPNSGALVEVGSLLANVGTIQGFDISPNNINSLLIGKVGDSTKLYTLNLTTGEATLAGKFVKNTMINSIAIVSTPVFYATDQSNNFLIFNPNLNSTVYSKPITGLQAGETIVGMDMRPSKGQIYALGSSSRLYTVNIGTGEFTQVGTGTLSTALTGTRFGFDFNPVDDLIRIVSNTGQNLRVNPTTAEVTIDPNITPTTATLTAAAFSSNFAGATSTLLYVIDNTTNKLFTQEANTGKITEVGDLKVGTTKITPSTNNGFDIISTSSSNDGYAIFTVGLENNLYQIDLSSGTMTVKGSLGSSITAFTLGLRF